MSTSFLACRFTPSSGVPSNSNRMCGRTAIVDDYGVVSDAHVGDRYHRHSWLLRRPHPQAASHWAGGLYSKAKIRFQSFFMLMTTQPCLFALSYNAWVKVPTLVAGNPWAGP